MEFSRILGAELFGQEKSKKYGPLIWRPTGATVTTPFFCAGARVRVVLPNSEILWPIGLYIWGYNQGSTFPIKYLAGKKILGRIVNLECNFSIAWVPFPTVWLASRVREAPNRAVPLIPFLSRFFTRLKNTPPIYFSQEIVKKKNAAGEKRRKLKKKRKIVNLS